jgi:hypothetical protein
LKLAQTLLNRATVSMKLAEGPDAAALDRVGAALVERTGYVLEAEV